MDFATPVLRRFVLETGFQPINQRGKDLESRLQTLILSVCCIFPCFCALRRGILFSKIYTAFLLR